MHAGEETILNPLHQPILFFWTQLALQHELAYDYVYRHVKFNIDILESYISHSSHHHHHHHKLWHDVYGWVYFCLLNLLSDLQYIWPAAWGH